MMGAVPLPDPTRTILKQSALPLVAGAPVHSCLLELRDWLDIAFDIDQFKAAGMAVPAQIARSVPSRQAEFFHGRWAARMALAQAMDGVPVLDIPIGASREPVWPAGMVGSLTHCQGFAAAAVARVPALQALGIDIERVATGESLHALRTTTLNEAEIRLLHAREPALPAPVLITLAFSAKESLFKAAFPTVQRYFDFDAARVVNLSPSLHQLVLALTEDLAPGLRAGDQITASYRLIRPDVVFTSLHW